MEVKLTTTDSYEWSARLVDVNDTEISRYSRKATLNAGMANINFVFDGQLIGRNDVDGLIFSRG